MHRDLAAHWWPTKQSTHPTDAALLPSLPATLQAVIDHLGLRVLGQRPGADISSGIATLLGKTLTHKVTTSEAGQYWTVIGIVSSLLDSPIHLHR